MGEVSSPYGLFFRNIYNHVSSITGVDRSENFGGIIGYLIFNQQFSVSSNLCMDYIHNDIGNITGKHYLGGLIAFPGYSPRVSAKFNHLHSSVNRIQGQSNLAGLIPAMPSMSDAEFNDVSVVAQVYGSGMPVSGVFSTSDENALTRVLLAGDLNVNGVELCSSVYANNGTIHHQDGLYVFGGCNSAYLIEDGYSVPVLHVQDELDDLMTIFKDYSWGQDELSLNGQTYLIPVSVSKSEIKARLPTPDPEILAKMNAWIESLTE